MNIRGSRNICLHLDESFGVFESQNIKNRRLSSVLQQPPSKQDQIKLQHMLFLLSGKPFMLLHSLDLSFRAQLKCHFLEDVQPDFPDSTLLQQCTSPPQHLSQLLLYIFMCGYLISSLPLDYTPHEGKRTWMPVLTLQPQNLAQSWAQRRCLMHVYGMTKGKGRSNYSWLVRQLVGWLVR